MMHNAVKGPLTVNFHNFYCVGFLDVAIFNLLSCSIRFAKFIYLTP